MYLIGIQTGLAGRGRGHFMNDHFASVRYSGIMLVELACAHHDRGNRDSLPRSCVCSTGWDLIR